MFVPTDPRFDELLHLAEDATSAGLKGTSRQRWRELVNALLGEQKLQGRISERRQHLRAAASLEVHLLAPEEMAGLVTSTIGPGGLSLALLPGEEPPLGTILELSIKVAERPVPLLLKASVVWVANGLSGAAFIDAYVHDRELLEGIAVKALLARAALE